MFFKNNKFNQKNVFLQKIIKNKEINKNKENLKRMVTNKQEILLQKNHFFGDTLKKILLRELRKS